MFRTQHHNRWHGNNTNTIHWPRESCEIYVAHRKAPNILGAETCRKRDLVRCMNTINKTEQAKHHSNSPANDILKEPQYAELFEGLGCLPGKYYIKLDNLSHRQYTHHAKCPSR